MVSRKRSNPNNHLQEAMALLIRNQAAFVEQISRNDRERLALERRSESDLRDMKEWQRKSDERFARIEAELRDLPGKIIQAVLDQMPRIKKEIGFGSRR